MNLIAIKMFKRHIDDFFKTSQNSRFIKMRRKSTKREKSNVGCFSKPEGPL